MQINRYLKQMNGPHPSSERVRMTALGLNHTLKLIKSLRKMCRQHAMHDGKMFPGTLHDAELVFYWLQDKVGGGMVENPPIKAWNKQFWQDGEVNNSRWNVELLLVCEKGSDDIYLWFLRNQQFITETHEKLSKKKLVAALEDDDLDESDDDFDY